jgi:Tol biopolymer transport system component
MDASDEPPVGGPAASSSGDYHHSIVSLEAGTSLGPYEILESVGAGGMGEVYRARDSRLGRQVAIKILPPALARDEVRLARFEREARLCSSLNHPNIVTIYELGRSDDLTFIAMELVEGKSLRSLAGSGPVPLRKLIPIAAQAVSGVAAAHGAGIVHRDLKPENVMVTPSGTVKVLDFGLAKGELAARDATTSLQLTGDHHVMGTAAYMSPEQAAGSAVDYRSDQFSLGSIFYEMASGKHPFRRSTTLEMLAAIHDEDPPSLAEVDAEIPEPFAWIVERCLAKSPSERYASTVDLARDLERLRDLSGRRPSIGIRRRERLSMPVAALAIGVVLVALAAGFLLGRRPRTTVPRAPMRVTLSMPEVLIPVNETYSPVVLLPDGRRVVMAGQGEQYSGLWLRDLGEAAAKPIAGTEDGRAPALSPDGQHVAFFATGKLKAAPLNGGAARVLCDVLGETNPSWGPDGNILFSKAEATGSSIFSVPASGGNPVRVTSVDHARHEVYHAWPHHLPDGKHFFYLAGLRPPGTAGIQRVLMVANLDGREAKAVTRIDSRAVFHKGRLLFVRGGDLLAQPFDLDSMSLTGEPAVIAERVYYYRPYGTAAFAVSESGTIVYREARAESRLLWFSREGFTGELAHGVLGREAGRVSPDGRRFAVAIFDEKAGAADIWVYDLARGAATRLTYDEADDTRPVWSADGRSVFIRSDSAGLSGPPDVYRVDLADPKKKVLVYHGPDFEEPADASPDGTQLIVDQVTPSGRDVLLLPLVAGAKPSDLVRSPFDEGQARFSPDGRSIAFGTNVSGRTEVYLLQYPERGAPLQVSVDGGARPRWRGDGEELYFLARGLVMSVAVRRTGGAIECGEPKLLFRPGVIITEFEALPDGKRFLVRSAEEVGPHVHLVIDALADR